MNFKKILSAAGLLTITVPTSLSVIACDVNTIFSKNKKNTTDEQIIDEINNAQYIYYIEYETKVDTLYKIGLAELIKQKLTQDNKEAFDTNKFEVISFRDSKTWLPISDDDFNHYTAGNEAILDYKYNNIKSRTNLTFNVVINNPNIVFDWILQTKYFMSAQYETKASDILERINGQFIIEPLGFDAVKINPDYFKLISLKIHDPKSGFSRDILDRDFYGDYYKKKLKTMIYFSYKGLTKTTYDWAELTIELT